jgi:hypothetical protein
MIIRSSWVLGKPTVPPSHRPKEAAPKSKPKDTSNKSGDVDNSRRKEALREIAESRAGKLEVPDIGDVIFRKHENSGGGDCQFESILQGLQHLRFILPLTVAAFRRRIADAIREDGQKQLVISNTGLENVVLGNQKNYQSVIGRTGETLRAAFVEGVEGGWWGDEVTLRYACEKYLTRFVILRKDNTVFVISPRHEASYVGTVFLWYDLDVHYTVLEILLPGRTEYLRALGKSDLERHIVEYLRK